MSGLGNLIAAAAVLSAAGALAAPAHLNDSQFIAAAHCQGLYDSHALGAADAKPFDAMMKAEGRYRPPEVIDFAEQARSEAMRAADHAGALAKTQMVSERDGACVAWTQGGASSGVASRAP